MGDLAVLSALGPLWSAEAKEGPKEVGRNMHACTGPGSTNSLQTTQLSYKQAECILLPYKGQKAASVVWLSVSSTTSTAFPGMVWTLPDY